MTFSPSPDAATANEQSPPRKGALKAAGPFSSTTNAITAFTTSKATAENGAIPSPLADKQRPLLSDQCCAVGDDGDQAALAAGGPGGRDESGPPGEMSLANGLSQLNLNKTVAFASSAEFDRQTDSRRTSSASSEGLDLEPMAFGPDGPVDVTSVVGLGFSNMVMPRSSFASGGGSRTSIFGAAGGSCPSSRASILGVGVGRQRSVSRRSLANGSSEEENMPMRRMMSSWSAASFKAEQEGGGEASPIDLQPASLRLVVCGTLCGTLNNASFCVLLGAAQKVAADFDRVNDVSLMTMMGTVGCLAGIVLNAKLCVGFSTETRRLSMLLTLITFGYLVIIFAYHFLEGTAAGFFLCVSASMLLGGASAAGEVLNLGLFRAFAPTMLSSWGAGTGMSGIFGPSIYLALTTGLGLNSGQVCWFLIATLPLYFFFFWTIVRARDEYDAAYFEEEEEGFASDNEVVERPHVPIENQAAPSGSTTVVTHTEQASTTSGDTSTTRDAVSSSGNSSSSSRSGSATTTGDQGSSGVASSNSLASTASTSAGSGSDVPPNQDEPAPDVVPPKRRSPSRRSVAGRTSILEQGGDLMYPEAAVPVFRTSSIPQIDNLLRSPVSVPVSRRSRSRESILGGIDENGGMNAVSTCSLTAANTNVNAQKHGDVGEQEQHDESVAAVSREPNDGADADVNSSRMKMSGAQSPSEQPQSIALTWRNFRKVVTKCRFIMMNMVAVYSLEYLIMSGALDRVTLCPTSQSFIATDAYTVYWCLYNVGVTLSRASVALFRIQRVWILTVIQLINTMLWYTEAFVQLHRHLFPAGDDAGYYIMAVHMIWVGFMGGACYSNCMFLFNTSKSIPAAYRELGLNVGFLFSNLGIISATFLAFLLDATVMSNKKLFPPDGSCPAAGMEEAGIAASGTSTVDSSSHNAATLPPSSSFGGDNYVPLDINGNMVFTNGNVFPGTAAAVISLVSKRFLGAAAP